MIISGVKKCLPFLLALILFAGPALSADTPVTAARAQEIAVAQAGGGEVVVLERKDLGVGAPYYRVEVLNGGDLYAMEIDAANGGLNKLVKKGPESVVIAAPVVPSVAVVPVVPVAPADAGISVDQARAIALRQTNGGVVVEADIHGYKKGRPVYEFEIINNGVKYDIEIDGVSGGILKSKVKGTNHYFLGVR